MVRSRPLVTLFLTLALASSLQAAPLKTSYEVTEHGQRRTFVIAQDELHQQRRAVRVSAKRTMAELEKAATASGSDLVVYEKGAPRNAFTRRLVTRRISVHLAAGTDPAATALAAGATYLHPVAGTPGWFLLESSTAPGSSLQAAEQLRQLPGVLAAEPQLARQQEKRFTPNDTLFGDQWYLRNTGQAGGLADIDINVSNAWNSYQGTGMTIGIVDDGLQRDHPDLKDNYDAADSYDFNQLDGDPLPPPFDGDDHGTACAGLAAGRGNNGEGLCGVAFQAQVAGLRLIAFPTTDADEAAAFAFHNNVIQVKTNSWGPVDDGRTLEGPGPLTVAALEEAVRTGRNGHGTIYVWAGGNGGNVDFSSYDGYASRREVIAVGAVDNKGKRAFYSELGANLLCAAPSSGGTLEIPAVDRPGKDGYNFDGKFGEYSDLNYTRYFGGTSASAPLVAGTVALMLQANPALGWRDVQEILITTARKIDATNTGWHDNGIGLHFNDRYGAGLVDATTAVIKALSWTNLPPEISAEQTLTNLAQPIPDNKPNGGVLKTFVFNDPTLRVEHVELTVDILHTYRGQIEITATSPAGTVIKLAPARTKDHGSHYVGWTFTTPQFWGETAQGTWTVRVADRGVGTVGTLRELKLALYGSSQAGHAAPQGYQVTGGGNAQGDVAPGSTVTVAFQIRNDGATALSNLSATLLAAGGVTNPSAPVSAGSIAPGSTGTATFTFAANGALGETIHATLTLQNGGQPFGAVTFPIVLGSVETLTFRSTDAIEIPAFPKTTGNADPYASPVNVLVPYPDARITKVVLRLEHFNHTRSRDVDMLLVSPGGAKMIPLSDVGGDVANDVNLEIRDDAEVPLPETVHLYSGTYAPANYGATLDVFPSPALKRPYDAHFATFTGGNPNGLWKLFTRDDAAQGAGGLGAWSLEISYAH